LILDSNEYIFGLSGTKVSRVKLIDQLNLLRVFVPLRVVREVERNLESMYGLGTAFFLLIINKKNIIIVWSPPPENLVLTDIDRGFSREDATIAASVEQIRVEYLISENRHFLKNSEALPCQVINAETALKLLQKT
jgi:hypothetical protein